MKKHNFICSVPTVMILLNIVFIVSIGVVLQIGYGETVVLNMTNSTQVSQLIEKGNDLFNMSKFEDALVWYDIALSIQPENVDALTRRGIALGVWGDLDGSDELGKYEDALALFNKALNIDPQYVDTLDSKGLALDRLGKYDEAIILFDKILAINPEDFRTLTNKGVTFYSSGKPEEDLAWIDKALDINPTYQNALDWKELILSEQK